MAEPAANIAEYTVSEISVAVKRTIEDAFGYVRVRGEVSGYRGPHSSGHAYFVLKDDKARLEAVVWRGAFRKLKFKPEEGLEVVATGRLTTYPGSSKYQIVIESLQPAGAGALMALLEERRKKLAAEGLFDEARKKPLPYLPRVIGVVTSPTGAVIRDILHRLSDRFPVRVIVWPVRVQGETSAAEVAAAVAGFNALKADGTVLRPDVLIVARGGGSLEDLWSFSEEIVVRAVAASQIPVIAAVGHETDWTLIDHVADRRAPTPTGAAEIAVPVRAELVTTLQSTASRLIGGALRLIEGNRRELRGAARALPRAEDLFAAQRRTFDELAGRLAHALVVSTQIRRTQFERVAARHSPHNLGRLSEGLSDQYAALMQRVDTATARIVERARSRYQQAVARHSPRNLMRLTEGARERIGALSRRGGQATARLIERSGARYGSLAKLLEALSYRKVLQRGFALVSSGGTPLRSASSVAPGNALDIEFHDGHVAATANAGGTRPKSRKRPAPKGSQGSLF